MKFLAAYINYIFNHNPPRDSHITNKKKLLWTLYVYAIGENHGTRREREKLGYAMSVYKSEHIKDIMGYSWLLHWLYCLAQRAWTARGKVLPSSNSFGRVCVRRRATSQYIKTKTKTKTQLRSVSKKTCSSARGAIKMPVRDKRRRQIWRVTRCLWSMANEWALMSRYKSGCG